MQPTRGPARWMAGVVVALLTSALAAVPGISADAAAPATPSVGECRQLTPAQIQADSDTSAAVPCSQRHDDRVIAVPRLPSGVGWRSLRTSKKLFAMAVSLCYPPYRRALGQDDSVRDRTAYTFLFFEPTKQQRRTGARWIRCDLALRHGTTYASLPTDREPALNDATPAAGVARCLRHMRTAFLTTTCRGIHQYRSSGAFLVRRRMFPGRTALLHAGRSRCPALVSTDTDFRFTWSPAPVWNRAHDRIVVCYSHSTT